MKIATFSHYFTPEIGAPSARLYDMAQQWLSMGHEADVITCFPNHPAGKLYPGYTSGRYLSEKLDGIQVHRHWTYITPNRGFLKKALGHASFFPSALWTSNRRIAPPDITIGTSPTFFAAMAAASAATRHSVPFVLDVRDLWPAAMVELGVIKQPLLIRLLEKWELALYRRADRIVTVTEAFRCNLIKRGVASRKVRTISNGADENFWRPIDVTTESRAKLGLAGKFVVLYIGAHGISQALEGILESAKRLAEYSDICFLFVGEGSEKARLVQLVRDAELNNVRFLASVDKGMVKTFYALADICLVPLRNIPIFKTFIPSKMFEMMAMKRPIIASVSGEAAEILSASGGALVVEPEDSGAIAESILKLYRAPDRLVVMGEQGRQYVIENYSRRSLARRYVDLLDEAIAEKRDRSGGGKSRDAFAPIRVSGE